MRKHTSPARQPQRLVDADLHTVTGGDIYMHHPRGSNDRLGGFVDTGPSDANRVLELPGTQGGVAT